MTTSDESARSLGDWIEEVNDLNAKMGDSSHLRLAEAGEIIAGRFGGLREFGTQTIAVVDRDAEDDAVAVPVTDVERERLRDTDTDAEIHLLARATAR